MRVCSKCKILKNKDCFSPDKRRNSLMSKCKDCDSKDHREARRKRGLKGLRLEGPYGRWSDPNYQHRQSMIKKYGITLEEYNKMFEEQSGCCKICGRHQSMFKKKLNIDHNHTTGLVRGLLCINCNHGIGQFKDSQYLLTKAIEYLEIDNLK